MQIDISIKFNHQFVFNFNIIVLFVGGTIILLSYNLLFIDIFAVSPSFSLIQITDDNFDWINLENKNFSVSPDLLFSDILAVDYWSDGRYLNATLWLSSPFNFDPSSSNYSITSYGMFIDSDFNGKTGFNGIDYKSEITWNNVTKKWLKILEKWSPNGKTFVKYNNTWQESFPTSGDGYYVQLSTDLDTLLFPEKYRVVFYTEVQKVQEKVKETITDFSRWVAIPNLELNISTIPDSINIRKGEEKTIEIKLESTKDYEATVNLDSNVSNYVFTSFKNNNTLRMPSYGIATIPLVIKAFQNAYTGPYTLFIYANSTFPPDELIPYLPSTVKPVTITKQAGILLTIQDELTPLDQINDFMNKAGSFLSFIYGIIAGISPWLYNKITEQLQKRKKCKLM